MSHPQVRADRKELFFIGWTATGYFEIKHASASATGFLDQGDVPNVNAPLLDDLHPSITEDGLLLFFLRQVQDGYPDVYEARRASVDEPFGAPVLISGIDTLSLDISADGLRLYTATEGIKVYTRPSLQEPFGPERGEGGTWSWSAPTVSSSGLEAYVTLNDEVAGTNSVARLTRDTLQLPFEARSLIEGGESDPDLAADGRTLVYHSGSVVMMRTRCDDL